MLRRRYHKKEKVAGKAKRRQKENAPVRYSPGSQRSLYRCLEDGYLIHPYDPALPYPASQCICFTGHRVLSADEKTCLRKKLLIVLNQYYQAGYRTFISGAALGFDTVAAEAVIALRDQFPAVSLVLALPCPSQADRWRKADQLRYQSLLSSADHAYWISPAYYPMCMQKRNRFMVDHSSICVCYMRECRGGTWHTVSYAYDSGLTIRNLALE